VIARCITFGCGVVVKVTRSNGAFVVIDVLTGLLPTNTEYLAEVACCQPSLPQDDNFNEAITQQLLPSKSAHAVFAGVVSSIVKGLSLKLVFTIPSIEYGL